MQIEQGLRRDRGSPFRGTLLNASGAAAAELWDQ